jgi:hypothetical protein
MSLDAFSQNVLSGHLRITYRYRSGSATLAKNLLKFLQINEHCIGHSDEHCQFKYFPPANVTL